MEIIEKLTDQTLVICENSYRENILKELAQRNLFLDVKFMSKKEFLQEFNQIKEEVEQYKSEDINTL